MRWKDAVAILIFGIGGMLSVQLTFYLAIHHGNAATATLLQYTAPVLVLIYTLLRNVKLPRLVDGLSILFALLGTALLVTGGDVDQIAISSEALFWGLLSAVALAFYTLQPVKLLAKFASPIVVGWGMMIAAVAFSYSQSPWTFSLSLFSDLYLFLGLVFVILFGTLLGFTFFLTSLRYLFPYEASILSCFEPLTAVLIGVVWMNLSFSLWDWLGSVLIILAVMLISWKKEEQKKK